MHNAGCLSSHSAPNSLPFRVRVGHNPGEETALCSDRHMPRCEVFLVLNYYGDMCHGVFGRFGIYLPDTPSRQKGTCYPPPPQPVRRNIWLQRARLVHLLRFPLTAGGGWEGRTGRGEACLAPVPIWSWGPAEGHSWARELGRTSGLRSTGTAFVLGRAAVSTAAPAT